LQRLLRILQFLSPLISLALFSSRLAKITRLTHRATKSQGAVEGILVAAVAYTLAVMILQFCIKRGAFPRLLRWIVMIMDLLFVGAFMAVAYLTRPHGGSAGPCGRGNARKAQHCKLPWGTFVLAIVSTVLHFVTALFHEVKERKRQQHERDGHAEDGRGVGNNNGDYH
ncbi:hypothetical protein EJ03DRAFT_268790, partial [Teratosphaeria nubilosa]